jgi:hypothetical protein
MVKKWREGTWTGLIWLRIGTGGRLVNVICEDLYLLKKNSSPWS